MVWGWECRPPLHSSWNGQNECMEWKVPVRLAATCRKTPERAAWLDQLPNTVRTVERRWSLTVGAPFDGEDVMEILMKHTGKTYDQIERDCDRDNFMSSQEAKDYGLVDTVLLRLPATVS